MHLAADTRTSYVGIAGSDCPATPSPPGLFALVRGVPQETETTNAGINVAIEIQKKIDTSRIINASQVPNQMLTQNLHATYAY